MLRAEDSVKQPLRAECGGKERFELTGQDPWCVAQTLRHREKLAELQARPFSAVSQDGSVPATVEKCDRAGLPGHIFVSFNSERDRWRSTNGNSELGGFRSGCRRLRRALAPDAKAARRIVARNLWAAKAHVVIDRAHIAAA